MPRGELLGSAVLLLLADEIVTVMLLSSAEAWEKVMWRSAASFVGEAKRLSGRMCSKLSERSESLSLVWRSSLLPLIIVSEHDIVPSTPRDLAASRPVSNSSESSLWLMASEAAMKF